MVIPSTGTTGVVTLTEREAWTRAGRDQGLAGKGQERV